MLRHLFKLIWNKKGAHSLLIIEIWASFMVLFGVLSLIVFNLNNYLQPIGYESVWNLDLTHNQDTTDVSGKIGRALQRIRSYPEVQSASRTSSNTPFSANQMSNSVSFNKASTSADFYYTDADFYKTLHLPAQTGRWYKESDGVSKFIPVVINRQMKEKLFADENPLGKILKMDDKACRILGTVDTFKAKGEFMTDSPAIFQLIEKKDDWNSNVLIKVRPGTDADFEAGLVKDLASMLPGWGIEVSYLRESRENRHKLTLVPVIIFLVVSGFLLTNVALGLFGILNLNIARRKNEIGLRRAMGATEGKVTRQFLGEIWVLASLSLSVGLVFAIQFPLMNVFDIAGSIYITAIIAAVVIIFIIVTLCAWYPSRQAARIHPASALHEE
jgi:putative ABC transport system permease protein